MIIKKVLNLSITILLILTMLIGCSSSTTNNEKDELEASNEESSEYPYIENNQYNINGVSDENNIYIIFKNKLFRINKTSHQYSVILESSYGLAGIALYKDWIYCIENPGQRQNTNIFRISKDGQNRVDLLSDALYYYCWIYEDRIYTLNASNNSLMEAYKINYDGLINEKDIETDDFLFKIFNSRQNTIIQELQDDNNEEFNLTTQDYDVNFLIMEGYNHLYNNISVDKSYLNEGTNKWIIKDSETEKEICNLDIFNDTVISLLHVCNTYIV